jgi:hypothetical protein
VTQRDLEILIAQQPRDFAPSLLRGHHRHVARRYATLRALRHHEVMIGPCGDLWQVRDDEHLAAPRTGDIVQRCCDAPAHLATDSLIDLVEHERRDGVVSGERDLQGQHQPRQLAA